MPQWILNIQEGEKCHNPKLLTPYPKYLWPTHNLNKYVCGKTQWTVLNYNMTILLKYVLYKSESQNQNF